MNSAETNGPLLDVKDLVVGYGQTEILHGVNLRVQPLSLIHI